MFQSTTGENFQSWDKFLDAYYEPIRSALGLIPFIGEARADDIAQTFFLKLYERDFLEKRPQITGRFRNWLYVAARRHAVDEMRKLQRSREHPFSGVPDEPKARRRRVFQFFTRPRGTLVLATDMRRGLFSRYPA